jgi:8-oxo-dGTP pyrophosphatase MutT (NUDIX family)
MQRQLLLNSINDYLPLKEEGDIKDRFIAFINAHLDCFDRSCSLGHITGSSFVISPDKSSVLLSFHRKLNIWVQLGGHADGEADVTNVALREAHEESGIKLNDLYIYKDIIDLDIHLIPKNQKDEAHFHFDVRFIVLSNTWDFICSEESLQLKWVKFNDIEHYSKEVSLIRALNKICKKLNIC